VLSSDWVLTRGLDSLRARKLPDHLRLQTKRPGGVGILAARAQQLAIWPNLAWPRPAVDMTQQCASLACLVKHRCKSYSTVAASEGPSLSWRSLGVGSWAQLADAPQFLRLGPLLMLHWTQVFPSLSQSARRPAQTAHPTTPAWRPTGAHHPKRPVGNNGRSSSGQHPNNPPQHMP
jgi:hypothetical protein